MATAEYHRQWREAHRESVRASARRYAARKRARDPEAYRAAARQHYRTAGGTATQYARRARRLGIPFDLTKQYVFNLTHDLCFYCGTSPSPVNGIDRVDNSGGYVLANVVPCCYPCNRAKNQMSLAEFDAWAARLAHRLCERQK